MSEERRPARIPVRLTARGGADRMDGWRDGVLLARVRAPAVDGRANEALIALLAEALGVRAGSLSIVHGHTARTKLIGIDGLAQTEAERRLGAAPR